jgi:hypothetical protein
MNRQKDLCNMQTFLFPLLIYWLGSPVFLEKVARDVVGTVPLCGNLQNLCSLCTVPLHNYDTSRTLSPPALHTRHLSCVTEGVGQCLLPQTSSLATCFSTLGGLPNGLGTLHCGPGCASIFLTRVNRKSLCQIFLPHKRNEGCSY